MKQELVDYLKNLRQYGLENDIPNVTDEVGRFLNMMIKIKKPKTILEIGCANGYSTIWMAEAACDVGAMIYTVDHSAPTFAEAQKNLKEVELSDHVSFNFGDARNILPQMPSSLYFDFVFVDGQKASYLDFWNLLQSRLSPGSMLVWDDMLAFQQKTKSFSEAVKNLKGFDQLLIPIDKDDGILLMLKD